MVCAPNSFLQPIRHQSLDSENTYHPELGAIITGFKFEDISREGTIQQRIDRDQIYRVLLHEQTHHLQYASTTFGLFMQLGGFAISRIMTNQLKSMNRKELIRFRTAFPLDEDAGLWDFDNQTRTFKRIIGSETGNPSDAWREQISLEYALCFLHKDNELAKCENSTAVFMANALLLMEHFGRLPFSQIVFTPDQSVQSIQPGTHLGRVDGITTNDLLESSATTMDYLATAATLTNEKSGKVTRYAREVTKRLFLDKYRTHNKAWRYFLGAHSTATNFYREAKAEGSFLDAVITFQVLADMALNPPLPPVYKPVTGSWEGISWPSLHPPLRYQRYVQVAANLPLLSVDATKAELLSFIKRVTRLSGLQSFTLDAQKLKCRFALWNRNQTADTFSLPESFVVQNFTNFGFVRAKCPQFVNTFALALRDCDLGEQLRKITGSSSETLLAPFNIDAAGQFHSFLEEPHASELAGAFSARYFLRRIGSAGPKTALSHIPSAYQESMGGVHANAWMSLENVVKRYVG